jgi:hypothetical protein
MIKNKKEEESRPKRICDNFTSNMDGLREFVINLVPIVMRFDKRQIIRIENTAKKIAKIIGPRAQIKTSEKKIHISGDR